MTKLVNTLHNQTDRRQAPRIQSKSPVVMKGKESTVFAIMTDFSENGLGFMALCDVCRDENVEVYFDIAFNDQHKSFCFDATVMHCVPNSDKCQIGVRFDQSKPEYSCLFEKFLNH